MIYTNEKITLSLDPILYNRLKTVYSFDKNMVNIEKKPPIDQWIVEEILIHGIGQEELRIANQSFYSQRSVDGEIINKPQVIPEPYVAPIPMKVENESEFSDDLAVELNLLDFKKKNDHVSWDCCSCYHCSADDGDVWDRDPCYCHRLCVCWCNEKHWNGIFYKDGIKYQLQTKSPDMKCPGHSECKEKK